MTDIPISERQEDAIELQRDIAALPAGAAFHQDFIPHGAGGRSAGQDRGVGCPLAAEARTVFEEWRNGLATPEQMRRVVTNDELEVGAVPWYRRPTMVGSAPGPGLGMRDDGARCDLAPLNPRAGRSRR